MSPCCYRISAKARWREVDTCWVEMLAYGSAVAGVLRPLTTARPGSQSAPEPEQIARKWISNPLRFSIWGFMCHHTPYQNSSTLRDSMSLLDAVVGGEAGGEEEVVLVATLLVVTVMRPKAMQVQGLWRLPAPPQVVLLSTFPSSTERDCLAVVSLDFGAKR